MFLKTDTASIPAATGGAANLALRAGKGNANRRYFLVASLNGNRPGTLQPGGSATLPLNLDPLSFLVLTGAAGSMFQNFVGALDNPWNFVSNPVQIGITR